MVCIFCILYIIYYMFCHHHHTYTSRSPFSIVLLILYSAPLQVFCASYIQTWPYFSNFMCCDESVLLWLHRYVNVLSITVLILICSHMDHIIWWYIHDVFYIYIKHIHTHYDPTSDIRKHTHIYTNNYTYIICIYICHSCCLCVLYRCWRPLTVVISEQS